MAKLNTAIEVFLSDMDGTLLDTEAVYEAVDAAYMEKYDVVITPDEFAALRGCSIDGFFGLFAARSADFQQNFLDAETFGNKRIKQYYKMMESKPELVKTIDPVVIKLLELHSQGESVGIVTNSSSKTVRKTMKAAKLNALKEIWQSATTSDEVLAQGREMKPAGDPFGIGFQTAIQGSTKCSDPHNTLAWEDSKAGVRSVLDFGGHVIQIVNCDTQILQEEEVANMRKVSRYFNAFVRGGALDGTVMTYTACRADNFQDVNDELVEESRSKKGLKRPLYLNFA